MIEVVPTPFIRTDRYLAIADDAWRTRLTVHTGTDEFTVECREPLDVGMIVIMLENMKMILMPPPKLSEKTLAAINAQRGYKA